MNLKKLLSIVLILLSFNICMSVAGETYFDDFTGYTNNTVPGGNWVVTTPVNSAITVSDEMLKVTTATGFSGKAMAQYTLPTPLTGIVVVEYKIKKISATMPFCAPYIYSNSDALAVCSMFTNAGKYQSYIGGAYKSLTDYTAGIWYTVKHILNYTDKKFSLFVDGVEYATNEAFRNASSANLSYIQFYGERAGQEEYIDDLNIFTAVTPVLSDITFKDRNDNSHTGTSITADITACEVTFNTKMNPAFMSGVKIKNKTENTYEDYIGSLDESGKIYTLSGGEKLAAGEYTLEIPDSLRSADGVVAKSANYDFEILSNSISVTGIYLTAINGKKMKLINGMEGVTINEEAITVAFSKIPDSTALNSQNIVLEKNGIAAEYTGIQVGNEWIIRPSDGFEPICQYTITIKDVFGALNDTMENPVTLSFRTGERYIYEENFDFKEAYELANYGWGAIGDPTISYDDDNESMVYTLEKTNTGTQYEYNLAFDASGISISENDIIVFEYDMKAPKSANSSAPYITASNGQVLMGVILGSDGYVKAWNGSTAENVCVYTENTWHNYKICWNVSKGTYSVVYDNDVEVQNFGFRNNPSGNLSYKMNFYIPAERLGTLKLDNVKIYKAKSPEFSDSGISFINDGQESSDKTNVKGGNTVVKIPFVGKMAAGGTAVLTLGDKNIPTSVSLSPDKNAYIITPNSPLIYGGNYKLKLSGATSMLGAVASDKEYLFTTESQPIGLKDVAFKSGGVQAKFFNNTGNSVNAKAFLAVYNDNNTMIDCVCKELSLGTGDTSFTISTLKSGNLKLYLWEDTLIRPVEHTVYTPLGKENITEKAPYIGGNAITISNLPSKTYNDLSMEITGQAKAVNQVNILILKDGKTIADISDGNVSNVIDYIGQAVSDFLGIYAVNYTINPENFSGSYSVFAGGSDASAFVSKSFTYIGIERLEEIIVLLNQAIDGESLMALINTHKDELAVSVDEYNNMLFLEKSNIEKGLAAKMPFLNSNDFLLKYYDVYLSELMNYTTAPASVIDKFQKELKLDFSGMLGELFKEETGAKEALASIAGKRSDYTSVFEITTYYYEEAALLAVNTANRGNMISRLESFYTYLGIDITTNAYKNLTTEQKKTLAVNLVKPAGYNTVNEFVTAFNLAVAAANFTPDNGIGNPGGSGGGGGGGGFGIGGISTISPETLVDSQNESQKHLRFSDILEGQWYFEFVNELVEKGIVSGDGDGKFNPDQKVTRAEYIKMLVVAFKLYDKNAKTDYFLDIPENTWYSSYIASAFNHKIIEGNDNKAEPEGFITRQDAAVTAARTALKNPVVQGDMQFLDDGDISSYAKESVYALYEKGVINGMGSGMFEPLSHLTRAQAAKIICQILK